MHQATQNQTEPYENYDFCVVRCHRCLKESSVIIYKSDLTADEQVKYISTSTGFITDTKEGGLLCQDCCELKVVKGE